MTLSYLPLYLHTGSSVYETIYIYIYILEAGSYVAQTGLKLHIITKAGLKLLVFLLPVQRL